jgi:hypothetical protein
VRSVALAWATFVTWLCAAWLLPSGIAAQQEAVVEAGGALAAVAVTLLAVNLSAPLAARGKGHVVTGLRFALAVWLIPAGVALLSPGLLVSLVPLAWTGAVILAAGLALAATLVMPGDHHAGMALAAAAVTTFAGWVLEAVAGHAHKVLPFVLWSALRGRGIATGPSGGPLGFADLYDHRLADASYALVTGGIAAVAAGFGATQPAVMAAGGGLLAAAGLVTAGNLSVTPALLARTNSINSQKGTRA